MGVATPSQSVDHSIDYGLTGLCLKVCAPPATIHDFNHHLLGTGHEFVITTIEVVGAHVKEKDTTISVKEKQKAESVASNILHTATTYHCTLNIKDHALRAAFQSQLKSAVAHN